MKMWPCSLGEGLVGPVAQRTQGQRLEPPTHGYFSFLSSVPWTLTQNTQEGRGGFVSEAARRGAQGPRPEGNMEWLVPALPQALVPTDHLSPWPQAPAIWDMEHLCLLLGRRPGSSYLGPRIWRPPPPRASSINHSDCGTHRMGVLPRGRALPTGLQTSGKQSVRKSHFHLRSADAHSRWPQPPRPATSDVPECHLGDAHLHGAPGSAPLPLLG